MAGVRCAKCFERRSLQESEFACLIHNASVNDHGVGTGEDQRITVLCLHFQQIR